jgi:DNA/RNA-binding domain of Phe-tRNA-synthetase-like protein
LLSEHFQDKRRCRKPWRKLPGIDQRDNPRRRQAVLRDRSGVFGNPTADSKRTAICSETTSALAIFFCPPEVDRDYLMTALENYYLLYSEANTFRKSILSIT